MAKFSLNSAAPPRLSDAEHARLGAMSDAEITAAAKADADNTPLTAEERARIEAAQIVRCTRAQTGLSQDRFAKRYRITVGRLRDL